MSEDFKNSYKIYSNDIKKFGILTTDEEKELYSGLSNCNSNIKVRNELIMSNLRLVMKIANRYKNRGVDLDELVCEGNKGLVTAALKFNTKHNTKFSTYAYFWITEAILTALKENNKWNPTSTKNVLNYDDICVEKDLVVNMNEFEDEYSKEKFNKIINNMNTLGERDSLILKHYFGINGCPEIDVIGLAEMYNVSTVRISNIIEKSIRKLRCDYFEQNQ